jgi:hypothetical protein
LRTPNAASVARIRELAKSRAGDRSDVERVGRLSELDLSMGAMTDAGARSLAAHAKAFAHLKLLDVSGNLLSKAGVAAVRKVAKRVVTTEQRDRGSAFVPLGE